MAIGGAAPVAGDAGRATRAFREAVRMVPQATEAWIMIIRILDATGDRPRARAALEQALAANLSDAPLRAFERGWSNSEVSMVSLSFARAGAVGVRTRKAKFPNAEKPLEMMQM